LQPDIRNYIRKSGIFVNRRKDAEQACEHTQEDAGKIHNNKLYQWLKKNSRA
jgi:hypothetical protein